MICYFIYKERNLSLSAWVRNNYKFFGKRPFTFSEYSTETTKNARKEETKSTVKKKILGSFFF